MTLLAAASGPDGPAEARGGQDRLATTPAEEYEELYHQAPCGYLTCDDDGAITRVNDTFLEWTGHGRDELVGARLQSLLPMGDQILYTAHCLPQLRTSGALAEVLVEVVAADGSLRPALLSATRTAPGATAPAEVRVIVFSAHHRRQYEHELVGALRRAESSEARRAEAEAEARHLAAHDALTGLLNRAGLIARLDQVLAAEGQAASTLGVLFMDLDHFKAVNDSLGHAAGDELLVVVADRLRSVARPGGIVARLSGDEFVVTGEVAGPDDAVTMARAVLDTLAEPVVIQGLEIVVTASVGGALRSDELDATEKLLHHADVAMYRAKASGPNQVQVHDPTSVDPAVDRLRLLGDLRRGVLGGELRVHYQPRVDLRTGLPTGAEALVRWMHPERGLVPPSDFIPVAEQSGLIRQVGQWVLDAAVAEAVRWTGHFPGLPPLDVSVNLSARQLSDPELVGTVTDILAVHGLEAGRLVLEITETALIEHPEAASATLEALKALGVRLAVDDFGTGYASLTYLQRFPLDELKIDRSFVLGLDAGAGSDRAIVSTCVQLAQAIGVCAVAEGVETSRQRELLLAFGCELGQGFLFTAPLPPEQFADWVHAATA
ncbi:EAL domain-containing protein [Solicola sp. PLA-1-18]|uniref:EAL domain-containing protein n=1 Tax=Solicola sp. PLA-1-18 TaxID=3380532 RepID=UPI003B7F3203